MSYFSNSSRGPGQGEKFVWSTNFESAAQSPLSPLSQETTRSGRSKKRTANVSRPWRHSVSQHILSSQNPPTSTTVRQFKQVRQRKRLFFTAFIQWLVTLFFCILLGLCLWGFSQLQLMQVWQIKVFNALMVLGSLWLGNNLVGSLKNYAMMIRWRVLGMKHRPLLEADLIMHCESLRKVLKLLWIARPTSGWGLSLTQVGCIMWLGINLMLAVLVALLGLTYNLETAKIPQLMYGNVSIANMTVVRDSWGSHNPTFSAQLGAAQSFGVQGQDYNFTDGPVPGQGKERPVFGSPYTPNIYGVNNWTEMRYYFMDLNPENPNLSVLSRRYVAVHANCTRYPLVSGGNGVDTEITYTDLRTNQNVTINVVRVGPGATTYISALNSTCGPRCTEIFSLQSAGNSDIPSPSFFHCNSTITPIYGIEPDYASPKDPAEIAKYTLADVQARIFAGSIGWSGFNYSNDDEYQYTRYPVDSWWSPNSPTDATHMANHIAEFAIEAIAAIDNNGDRIITQGWYPVPSQIVSVDWEWAATLLAVIPGLHFIAMVLVVFWAGQAIIRDESCISIAKLWHPVVSRLGNHGCLLTGEEICEILGNAKVKYGVKRSLAGSAAGGARGPADHRQEERNEADVMAGLSFENEIVNDTVLHVGMVEEDETGMVQWRSGDGDTAVRGRSSRNDRRGSLWQRTQVEFPEGLYDGELADGGKGTGYRYGRRDDFKRKLRPRRNKKVGRV